MGEEVIGCGVLIAADNSIPGRALLPHVLQSCIRIYVARNRAHEDV